jgi:hypothetical protein
MNELVSNAWTFRLCEEKHAGRNREIFSQSDGFTATGFRAVLASGSKAIGVIEK